MSAAARDEEAARAWCARYDIPTNGDDRIESLAAFRAEARRDALEEAATCATDWGCDDHDGTCDEPSPCCGHVGITANAWEVKYGDHNCLASGIRALAQESAR